jgi:16S rRNA processing protein RimM
MTDEELLLVGRVARAHGNRGQVIVNAETDFATERFTVGATMLLGPAGRLGARRIDEVRFHQGRPIVRFDGVSTMNDAEALAGVELWMPESAIPPLPAGTYYRHALVGCEVRDLQDAVVGRVTSVAGTLERSHLIVESARGEVLIPLVSEICVAVDPAARLIVVDPPAGLLDVNLRGSGSGG